MITIYSTFSVAIICNFVVIVCIVSASEWIISRFMTPYKYTNYYYYYYVRAQI